MNSHEQLFVKSFILPAKRERYISFLTNKKRREKLLDNLDHLHDLDEKNIINIPVSKQNATDICWILQEKGAGENCHVISTKSELDGKELPLIRSLEEIVGSGFGTYISCIAGRLGYYESEEAKERFILEAR